MARETGRTQQHRLEAARQLAIEALGAIANNHEKMAAFMSISGIEPAGLRVAAATPGFFPAVLEFTCADTQLLLEIAETNHRRPEDYDMARILLIGPENLEDL